MVKVNPRQARAHAEAIGGRAKTDRVDAAMLARLGAPIETPVRPMIGAVLDQMKEPHVARRALIKDRVKDRVAARLALLKRQAAQRLKQIDAQLAATDAEPASSKPSPVFKPASTASAAFQAPAPPPLSPC